MKKTLKALGRLAERADLLIDRFESAPQADATDWDAPSGAFRWVSRPEGGYLKPVRRPGEVTFDDLFFVERQKDVLKANTEQFLNRRPANNVLLTGARGTGKSSLVKACLNAYREAGLRVVEVRKEDLSRFDDICDVLAGRPERFIVYCDDLSFDENDSSYKAMKAALDGGLSEPPENVLIYATSNRRHLLPGRKSDNEGYSHSDDGELNPSEASEEKISLSERFGIWLSFYPPTQDEYLFVAAHWMRKNGVAEADIGEAKQEALNWALMRGSRSARVAEQFARDYAGKKG